ncbi:hypothetical protein QBC42DRAFT_10693 [Cladorrhinum samala]|uniref:Uncharacterized protein n=1 Tax=Cladorrhinum samala TaxID=585594 RepID=A0AAV9HF39_9PEZI|nr:hypothetical protein QBC42DRAFT_10693 [Cladorrhinum samala]
MVWAGPLSRPSVVEKKASFSPSLTTTINDTDTELEYHPHPGKRLPLPVTAPSRTRSARSQRKVSPYRPTTADTDPDILPIRSKVQKATPAPNARQIAYLVLACSFLPLIISAAINFSIAYAMYRSYDRITLWAFPSCLAGDAAVTIVLTCLVTWFIEYCLVRRDVRTGGVPPLGWIRKPEEDKCGMGGRFGRWFLFADGLGEGWGEWLLGQLMRIAVLVVGCLVVFWPVTVGVLIAIGKKDGRDWVYEGRWTPELFKLILGGVLGMCLTPLMAGVWLLRAGWGCE